VIHLKSSKARGDVTLRRYQHTRHGIVETLTRGNVVMVRPVFGLLRMPDNGPKQSRRPTERRTHPDVRSGHRAEERRMTRAARTTRPSNSRLHALRGDRRDAGQHCANKRVVIRRDA